MTISALKKTIVTAWSSGSITADANSDAIDMRDHTGLFVSVLHTGTLAGPVLLQGSDAVAGTYVTLTDSAGDAITIATLAGATATFTATVDAVYSPFVRLAYVDTSGTGTIVASVTLVRA